MYFFLCSKENFEKGEKKTQRSCQAASIFYSIEKREKVSRNRKWWTIQHYMCDSYHVCKSPNKNDDTPHPHQVTKGKKERKKERMQCSIVCCNNATWILWIGIGVERNAKSGKRKLMSSSSPRTLVQRQCANGKENTKMKMNEGKQ